MLDLTDQQTADELVVHVESGGTFAQFAESHRVERKTVSRRLAKLPDLLERVDAARFRAKNIAHHVERATSRKATSRKATSRKATAAVAVGQDTAPARAPLPYTRETFLQLVWDHANDPESKACPKALGILAEYELRAEVHAALKRAEREGIEETGTRTRRVNVDLPAPGSRSVIDAEVVKT